LKLENATKSRFFLKDRKPGVVGKQASRASQNFRQTASTVSEWMPNSLVTPLQRPVNSAYHGAPDGRARVLAALGLAIDLAAVIAKHSLSVLVNAFKGTSSRLLRKQRPDIASRYRDGVLWSPA
jgi:hypothetical protein